MMIICANILFYTQYLSKPLTTFIRLPPSQTFEGGTFKMSDAIEKTTVFLSKGAFLTPLKTPRPVTTQSYQSIKV